MLRRAAFLGYRSPDPSRTESAFDPVRERPDFKLLMMDLAMPAPPFAAAPRRATHAPFGCAFCVRRLSRPIATVA